jgi:predicted PhzF superfamily epimerase YddE/YHI9
LVNLTVPPGGKISVEQQDKLFRLRLPRWDSKSLSDWPDLVAAFRCQRRPEIFDAGRDVMAVFGSEDEVRGLEPDIKALISPGHRGFIATAASNDFDCVSRFFCPSFGLGVDEDWITGSAHCAIAPFWAERLKKTRIRAYQASAEGGELVCDVAGDSVTIGASAVFWKRSSITI